MRRTPGAPASRLCAVSLAFGMVVTVPNLGPSLALAKLLRAWYSRIAFACVAVGVRIAELHVPSSHSPPGSVTRGVAF